MLTMASGRSASPHAQPQPLLDVWLSDAENGQRVENLEQGTTFCLNVLAEARQPLNDVVFNFHCLNMDNDWVFAFSKAVEEGRLNYGSRIVAELENPPRPRSLRARVLDLAQP